MGHWGPAIFSNDTSADIKDEFNLLFIKKTPIEEIKNQIVASYIEGNELEENTDLWLSLSYLMWQVGFEDEEIKNNAIEIIDNGIDLKVWAESETNKQTLEKREAKLFELKNKILTSNPKPKKPKVKSPAKSMFGRGDCFAVPLKSGNYTGILILEEILNPDYYFVLIAQTNINSSKLPTIEDIALSNILIEQPYHGLNSDHIESIYCYSKAQYKQIVKTFIKIGQVKIRGDFKQNYLSFGFAPWQLLIDKANDYLVDGKESPKVKWKTKNYIRVENGIEKKSIWSIFKRKNK